MACIKKRRRFNKDISILRFSRILLIEYSPSTVNVDIFACIHFRAFLKIGNFSQIYFFAFFDIATSMWHYKSYFHAVYTYANI